MLLNLVEYTIRNNDKLKKGIDMNDIKVGSLASEYMAKYKGTDVVVTDVRIFVDFIRVDLSDGSSWFADR